MESIIKEAIKTFVARREQIFKDAFDHFQVPMDESAMHRVNFKQFPDGTEEIYIDKKLVITFNPVEFERGGLAQTTCTAITTYYEHWR
jgi:hypothetical protein